MEFPTKLGLFLGRLLHPATRTEPVQNAQAQGAPAGARSSTLWLKVTAWKQGCHLAASQKQVGLAHRAPPLAPTSYAPLCSLSSSSREDVYLDLCLIFLLLRFSLGETRVSLYHSNVLTPQPHPCKPQGRKVLAQELAKEQAGIRALPGPQGQPSFYRIDPLALLRKWVNAKLHTCTAPPQGKRCRTASPYPMKQEGSPHSSTKTNYLYKPLSLRHQRKASATGATWV